VWLQAAGLDSVLKLKPLKAISLNGFPAALDSLLLRQPLKEKVPSQTLPTNFPSAPASAIAKRLLGYARNVLHICATRAEQQCLL